MQVVAKLEPHDDVLATASRKRPDVALLDHNLTNVDVIEDTCRQLQYVAPGCNVLLLLERGARTQLGLDLARLPTHVGFMATDISPPQLVNSIRRLADGQPVIDTGMAMQWLRGNTNPLTSRERDVLRLTVTGAPPKEIATKLNLSVGTIRNYLSSALSKTRARTRIEAIRIAQESGWI